MSFDLIKGTTTETSGGWHEFQSSFKPIRFVPYRNNHVHIYDCFDIGRPGTNERTTHYFYTPLLLLDPETAEYVTTEQKHAVSFDIAVWNEGIENAVFEYMQTELKMNVEKAQIKLIPFEKLMLTCKTSSEAFQCPDEWQLYQHQKDMTFYLICPSKEEAEAVAMAMKTQPRQFKSAFEIKLKFSEKQTMRKEISINIESVFNGEFISKIAQKLPNASEILLTADDTNKLLSEAINDVMAQNSFREEAMKKIDIEKEIYAALHKTLVTGEKTVQPNESWNSVFWNEDRPDKIAADLNRVHKKIDKTFKVELVELVSQMGSPVTFEKLVSSLLKLTCHERGGRFCMACYEKSIKASESDALLTLLRLMFDLAAPGTSLQVLLSNLLLSPHEKNDKSNVEKKVKAFEEMLSKVEWNGKKFVPKPMTLTGIDLVRSKKEIKILVSSLFHGITMPVNINLDCETRKNNAFFDDLSARVRHLEEHSGDWKPPVSNIESETERKTGDLKNSLDRLAEKLVELELVMDKSTSSASENDDILRKEVGELKNDLVLLISDTANASERDQEIEKEVERLKKELLAKGTSLSQSVNEVKESVVKEMSDVKLTNARDQEKVQASLASVEKKLEQETALVKKQSSDMSSKMSSELERVQSNVKSVETVTNGRIGDLNASLHSVADKLVDIELLVNKSNTDIKNDLSIGDKELQGQLDQFKSETKKQLESIKELFRGELLDKETSLRRVMKEEKETIAKEMSSIKVTSAKRNEELQNSLKNFEQETRQALKRQASSGMSSKSVVIGILVLLGAIFVPFMMNSARLNELKASINNSPAPKNKVYFSARAASKRDSNGRIDFHDSNLLNVGWKIDLKKGIFTVPRDGHYALFFSSLSLEEEKRTALSIMRNDVKIVAARSDGEQPFTLSAVAMLKNGDQLSVVINHGGIRLWLPSEHKGQKYEEQFGPISVFSVFSID